MTERDAPLLVAFMVFGIMLGLLAGMALMPVAGLLVCLILAPVGIGLVLLWRRG